MLTLGQYLKKLRDERDLSLRELAQKLKCSAAFLSDIELGRRYPSDKVLADMAHVLGVKLEDLKKHDTRPPIDEIKQATASNPEYAFAFRTLIEQKVSPKELLTLVTEKKRKAGPK